MRQFVFLAMLLFSLSARAVDRCDQIFHDGPLPLSKLFRSGAAFLVLPDILIEALRKPTEYSQLLKDFYHPLNAALKDAIGRAVKKDWPYLRIHDAHVVFGKAEVGPFPMRHGDSREWTVRVTIPFPFDGQKLGAVIPIQWMSDAVFRDLPEVAAPQGSILFKVLEMGDHGYYSNGAKDAVHFDFEVELWP